MDEILTSIKNNKKGIFYLYNWFLATIAAGLVLTLLFNSSSDSWSDRLSTTFSRFFGEGDRVALSLVVIAFGPYLIVLISKLLSLFFPLATSSPSYHRVKRNIVYASGLLLGALYLTVVFLLNEASATELNILFFAIAAIIVFIMGMLLYILRSPE